jgi:hypothetical protein
MRAATFGLMAACLLGSLPGSLRGGTFTVTSLFDTGVGTLRQAIQDAVDSGEPAVIRFDIPGDGVKIKISSGFPEITVPIVIDGTTQHGYSGIPLIEIDGRDRDIEVCFYLKAGNSTLRGLIIDNFGGANVTDAIRIEGPGGNTIAGCWFGVTATGTTWSAIHGPPIHILNSPSNHIGGVTAADRNSISGGLQYPGLVIEGALSKGNVVSGNWIGFYADGSDLNSSHGGITIQDAPDNVIGGTDAGAGNVITGNFPQQILITGPGAAGNRVYGNLIGFAVNGGPIGGGNGNGHGVVIDGAPGNFVGGPSAGMRNVIGLGNFGVAIKNPGAVDNTIQGNFIGTDSTGTKAAGNTYGILLSDGSSRTLVGGPEPGARNLISGNFPIGLNILDSSDNVVDGNYIGTDVSGDPPIPNGTGGSIGTLHGVSRNNRVENNVISGNNRSGWVLNGAGEDVSGNILTKNLIGLSADGKIVIGNGESGVALFGVTDNTVSYNNIYRSGKAHGEPGVLLGSSAVSQSWGNEIIENMLAFGFGNGVTELNSSFISQNTFLGNAGIPIDRLGDGPTPNVPGGANNYPVFTVDQVSETEFKLSGSLEGTPNCDYTLGSYFVHIVEVNLSENGTTEEVSVLRYDPISGVTTIHMNGMGFTTFASGNTFAPTFPGAFSVSMFAVSASCGQVEASEFSPPVDIKPPPLPAIGFVDPGADVEPGVTTVTLKLTRRGDLSRRSSVRVKDQVPRDLAHGGAVPNVDYVPIDQKVVFGPGESEKNIEVQILPRPDVAFDRDVLLQLSEYDQAVRILDLFPWANIRIKASASAQPLPLTIQAKEGEGASIAATLLIGERVPLLGMPIDVEMPWETVGALEGTEENEGKASLLVPPNLEGRGEIFRGNRNATAGLIILDFTGLTGGPPTVELQFPRYGPIFGPDEWQLPILAPTGLVTFVTIKKSDITDPGTGTKQSYTNTIPFGALVSAAAEIVKLAADIQVEVAQAAACGCTPWAGAAGGTVGGVQKIVLGGGANGKCNEKPVVHVTGPGGIDVTLGEKERRRTFEPAADGQWTVTSTVCGLTKTVTLTLP